MLPSLLRRRGEQFLAPLLHALLHLPVPLIVHVITTPTRATARRGRPAPNGSARQRQRRSLHVDGPRHKRPLQHRSAGSRRERVPPPRVVQIRLERLGRVDVLDVPRDPPGRGSNPGTADASPFLFEQAWKLEFFSSSTGGRPPRGKRVHRRPHGPAPGIQRHRDRYVHHPRRVDEVIACGFV